MSEGPSKELKKEFVKFLADAIKSVYPKEKADNHQLELSLSIPDPSMGDLSSSIAFKLAREVKRNPKEIAKNLVAKMKGSKIISEFKDVNGYVNAFVDQGTYGELVLKRVMDSKEDYGRSEMGSGEKVIVEFPSVNPNKPWLVSHLRNALLGDVVSNLLESCSYNVEREDYIDDLGLQMAESAWGYMNLKGKPKGKIDQWFGEQYVEVNKELEKEKVKEGVGSILKKLEELDSKESKIVREEIAQKTVRAQTETAFAYNIFHDVMIWESDIVRAKLLEKALKLAGDVLEKPKSGKYAGATVVKLDKIIEYAKELEGSREDAKVIVRSNGAATYIGKDFAFHAWKFGLIPADFKFHRFIERQPNGKPIFSTSGSGEKMGFGNVKRAINIIDMSQSYEQTIMRIMFTLLGHKEISESIVHLAYAKVRVEGGDLSTRKGGWVGEDKNYTADDLLRETRERALELTSKSEKISNKKDIQWISNAIALSAIKFEYLRISPEHEITFSWERALNFEANSGPYVLYMYARAKKILKKAGYKMGTPTGKDIKQITRGHDLELLKKIGSAQEIIEKACNENRPNSVTDYLLDISSLFSKFYESMPVIKGEEAKNVRLAIVYSFAQTLQNMLKILGIETVEEM